MPTFSCVTPTFLPLIRFLIWFFTSSDKMDGRDRWKNGHLTPKTSLRLGFRHQMPHFSWVTLTFFSLSRFVMEFWLFWSFGDHFRLIWVQSWTKFPPLCTIWSGFESSHNKLRTNLGCILTFLDDRMTHHRLFYPYLTFFGVKCPLFHVWHPLFFLW